LGVWWVNLTASHFPADSGLAADLNQARRLLPASTETSTDPASSSSSFTSPPRRTPSSSGSPPSSQVALQPSQEGQGKEGAGEGHLRMEIRFPPNYPSEPPFFRVLYPRFQWHTGHVSWGGSVCLEALVNTGGPLGYQSHYTVEALLVMVVFNLTLDNPGANVASGRLDFKREKSPERTGYELSEAKNHFQRILRQHGWTAGKPICQFSPNCYRKNPQHWEEYEHPGQNNPSSQ